MTPPAAQLVPALGDVATVGLRLGGLALLSLLAAAATALVFRWYARRPAPEGVALLVGLATVAAYLNVKTALGEVVQGQLALLATDIVVFNSLAFLAAALATPLGRRLGDRLGTDAFTVAGARELDAEVSALVQAVGRVVAVELPADVDDIGDVESHDPVPEETKAALAGKTFLFPRGLTVAELRERLVTRLKTEYGVGYVDLDLDADGSVAFVALGARAAGIGPTLAPGTAAVAVTADPPNGASPGDLVQVWETGDAPRRVATAELRATAGDVVTLALDEPEAEAVAGGEYRLMTLPTEPRPERAFAGLLRAADETMDAVRVAEGSPFVGNSLGSLDATVTAVRTADGTLRPIPARSYVVSPGDTLYVVARPETLRRLETADIS